MKILFYGRLAESIGRELELQMAAGCSVAELRRKLELNFPEAGATLANRRSRACVGDALVHDDYVLRSGDTVGFLPPVSGG